MIWVGIFLVLFVLSFALLMISISVGLSSRYRYRPLWTTWPDWGVAIFFVGLVVFGILYVASLFLNFN